MIIAASAILIFSVMNFGSVEIWSAAILEVSVFTLFLAWIIGGRSERSAGIPFV